MTGFTTNRMLLGVSAVVLAAAPLPVLAQAQTYRFDLSAQSLEVSLRAFARMTRQQILFDASLVRGKKAPALNGTYSAEQGLAVLLRGSGLAAVRGRGGAYVVAAVGNGGSADDESLAASSDAAPESAEIVVTGTNIKDAGPTGAQVIGITREKIADQGYESLPDALRSLPQNATIGASPVLQTAPRQNGSVNYGRGSSVNLRGLGPDATLVVLNGRRIAMSGAGTFVDISQIPLVAVERVDVLPEGSSAIYGSDAVGGVVNIVTQRRMRGVALEASGTLANDYKTIRASLATGLDWGSGGVTVAAEYRHNGLLRASDRSYFGADQTRFGGPDLRGTYCAPGTLTAGGVTYALPSGDGVGLTPGDLTAGTSNKCDLTRNATLIQRSDRWSGVLHADQDLGSGVRLFADFLYANAKAVGPGNDQISTLTVPSSNPYFIPFSPALTTVSVAYNFADDLGSPISIGKSNSLALVGGINYDFAPAWRVNAFYGYSRARDVSEYRNDINTFYLQQALASSDPSAAFNPFGSGSSNSASVLDTLRGYSIRRTRSEQHQVQVVVDGALGNPWGAGEVRVAIGGELLDQDYLETSTQFTSTQSPVPGTGNRGARSNKAVFAEISVPLVGPGSEISFLRSATLSAAVRRDDYNDFGDTTNPRLGLDVEPFAGFHLRGTWGRSFKAPLLSQLNPAFSAFVSNFTDPKSPSGTTTALIINKGVRPLRPETAESWTLGLAYADRDRSPFTFSATYFNIDYNDRIESLVGILSTILANDSIYANAITRSPTSEQLAAIQADPDLSAPFTVPAGGVGAIINYGPQNIASIAVRGLDVSAGYWWQTGLGRLSVGGSLSRMFDYDTRSAAGVPAFAAVGNIGYPNKWRATGDIALENDAMRIFTGFNILGSYRNSSVNPGQVIPAYVTINAGLRLKLNKVADWFPNDTSLQISALNLFDRDPPLVLGSSYGFDAYSADPIGRQVTLALRMNF